MIQENQIPYTPSKGRIALATVAALIVAGIVLVVAVLPAEYGIDPLGTGRALRLTELAAVDAAAPAASTGEAAQPLTTAQDGSPLLEGEIRTPAVLPGWNKDQAGLYKVDYREIKLDPRSGMEFKYRMEKGAGMVYVWDAPVKVKYEFHGEPDGSPRGTYESYSKDDKVGKETGSGSFIAPFSGIHGFYWDNPTDSPITIRLTSSGFYSVGKEFRKGFQGDHQLSDVTIPARQ